MSGEGREVYGSYQLSRAPACGTCVAGGKTRATKETPEVLRAKSRNRAAHRRAPHATAQPQAPSAAARAAAPTVHREYAFTYYSIIYYFIG